MSLYKYFGILFLKLISIRYATAQGKPCSELLSPKHQEGPDIRGTLFQYAPTGTCFLCTRKKSPGDGMSVAEIPLYNNVFDFGFNGKYFPSSFTTEIKMTEHCSLEITAEKPSGSDLSIKISICSNSSKTGCDETPLSQSIGFGSSNWNCLYVALAFVENQIYAQITSRCQHLASSGFNDSSSFKITEKECSIDDKTDLQAIIKTQHSGDEYDGFPVILPCSPGGYAVDPFTGRFAIGDQCYRFFTYLPPNIKKDGINFIIQKVYKSNEDLLFPKKAKKPNDVNPAYIQDKGEASSKDEMKAKTEANVKRGNGIRDYCNYDYNNRTCSVAENENKSCEILQCKELLDGSNVQEFPRRSSLNYYIHRNGCFLCSKPKCNFSETGCDKSSEIKDFPLYNNLIEFGIPALHFPMNTVVEIKITGECFYKVEIKYASQMASIGIYECSSPDKCTDLLKDSEKLELQLSFNNYYCLYLALAFGSDSEIHFATSDICKKFASVELQSNRTLKRQNDACAFDGKDPKLSAEFKFIQDSTSTHSGVPLIVPCSTGGIFVSPTDGRFITKGICRKIIWDSDIREKGLQFVISKFYDSNEDYLFKTENETNVQYPSPTYSQDGEKFIPVEEGVPKIVPNEKSKGKYRNGCSFPEKSQKKTAKTKTTRAKRTKRTKRTTVKRKTDKPPTQQERTPVKRQAAVVTRPRPRTIPPGDQLKDEIAEPDQRSVGEQTSEACYATFDIMTLLFVGFALTLY